MPAERIDGPAPKQDFPSRLGRARRDTEDLIATARALARVGAAAAMPYFRSVGLTAENKLAEGFDPVTEGDRAVERAIREVLAQRRPHDGIRGEEFGAVAGTSGLTWVIDPIDGTRAFLIGAPTWGILIALCDAEGPVLGLICQPHIGETWLGGLGEATVSGPNGVRALSTRTTIDLSQAMLCTTFPEIGTEADRAAFLRVAQGVRLVRYGLDCYAYGLLAAGHIDLIIEAGLQDYDICAPIAVIEAAGGVVTTWDGAPAHHGGRVIAAANPEIHAKALALLQAADP